MQNRIQVFCRTENPEIAHETHELAAGIDESKHEHMNAQGFDQK